MPEWTGTGKILMMFGAVLFLTGALLTFGPRVPFPGRLPGDILVEHKGQGFYFPVGACVLLSVILSILLNFFSRR